MKTDKTDILAHLRNADDYVSGQQLCDRFGVTRTAVWKAINQLKEEGYEIEALPHKGYRLFTSPDILSKEEIASRLATKWAGQNLIVYSETDSTNADAVRMGGEGAPAGTLVVADSQRAGRGRRGRRWESPAGVSLYMSLLLRPSFSPNKASMLTLVMALSAAETIEKQTGLATGIKWPNDILIGGRKVCGILTEMAVEAEYIQQVVIGVGLNVNQAQAADFPEEIRDMAASLRMQAGTSFSRAALAAEMMASFEKNYEIFTRTEDLSALKNDYQKRLLTFHTEVRVLDPQGEYTGFARGIQDTGELLVELPDGTVRQVYAGEVSVRGLYGYV